MRNLLIWAWQNLNSALAWQMPDANSGSSIDVRYRFYLFNESSVLRHSTESDQGRSNLSLNARARCGCPETLYALISTGYTDFGFLVVRSAFSSAATAAVG